MVTYSENTDIKLINGSSIIKYIDRGVTLEQYEVDAILDDAREGAYYEINDNWLKGKTAIPTDPATPHISALKTIEKNLVVSAIVSANYAQRQVGESELGNHYRKLADEALGKLQWPASSNNIVYRSGNTGNGLLTVVTLDKAHCLTEHWQIQVLSPTFASVIGSKTGALGLRLEPNVQYPDPSDTGLNRSSDYGRRELGKTVYYEQYPFQILLSIGSVAWTIYDIIEFDTYAASRRREQVGAMYRG